MAPINPIAEPGWEALPGESAESFLQSLSQRGFTALLLESKRRSRKDPEGVFMTVAAGVGQGVGTLMRYAPMGAQLFRNAAVLTAADLEVKDDGESENSSTVLSLAANQVPWFVET